MLKRTVAGDMPADDGFRPPHALRVHPMRLVKEGATTGQDMQDTLVLLKGTRVLGIAFNEVNAPAANSRYRNYYHYYAARGQRKM